MGNCCMKVEKKTSSSLEDIKSSPNQLIENDNPEIIIEPKMIKESSSK